MRILLDTHVALWAISSSRTLSPEVSSLLRSRQNAVFYSLASVWEVAVKHALRPEGMPLSEEEFCDLCAQTGFLQLPIEARHIFAVKSLRRPLDAPKHNDPFDRLLIAQAKTDGLTFLTHDSLLPHYDEPCIMSV